MFEFDQVKMLLYFEMDVVHENTWLDNRIIIY